MEKNLQAIIEKIKALEKELSEEIQKKEDEFYYKIRRGRVYFDRTVRSKHRQFIKTVSKYLKEANLLNILTVPVIWSCLVPGLFLDFVVSIFQAICFPVYGIPKVQRSKFIIFDRHALRYLNIIERINCTYCAYFNGLIAYVQEIAARTEQYWCPIKHAKRIASIHSRYSKFLEYGDAAGYRKMIESIRRDFEDIPET